MTIRKLSAMLLLGVLAASCADDPELPLPEGTKIEGASPADAGGYKGFYVLNEGNMGSNKCTLDYYDYATCTYIRNIYAERNPSEVLELGDSGNDIAIYGGQLYIVVNGSNKVEILDANTAVKIAKVDVASPRALAFSGDYFYVTSFVGGQGDNGSVHRFKIKDFSAAGSVSVGIRPETMAVRDGKLFVANSGDYTSMEYKNYISVINLGTFAEESRIRSFINLHHLLFDNFGTLWASSRGDYGMRPSMLESFAEKDGVYTERDAIIEPVSNMALGGDRLYFIGTSYDANWNSTHNYNYLTTTAAGFSFDAADNFITDGTQSTIATPYCIAVNPGTQDIYLTDVANYVSSGQVRCYSPAGKLKWTATTGDIPGHIAFLK